MVLPNGPEMATAFLAISSVCTCAPLNPAYSFDEFLFSLSDLQINVPSDFAGKRNSGAQGGCQC